MEKELKFNVMMKMAAGKTNKLIDDIYRIKSGQEVDLDQMIKMVRGIYVDEMEMIYRISHLEDSGVKEIEEKNKRYSDIQIPRFMLERRGEKKKRK